METKSADYYLGANLTAKKSVKAYSSPNGNLIKTYPAGAYVGTIYSYVLRDGFVWWQLNDGLFVKHESGNFDAKIAESTSSGKQIEEQKKQRQEMDKNPIGDILKGVGDVATGIGSGLSNLGRFLPLIIFAVLLMFIYLYLKPAKA